MGKQKGDASRSKNRPSSSGLAASLVPTGVAAVGFGGYSGSSRIEPSTSSASEENIHATDVGGELVQHLKRLSRKDPTTKLKALSSLSLLFKDKSGEEVAQIVPQWAFEYKKLLIDYNRDVRRATHETMSILVTKIKKGLAPYLKSLMGPWWFSQFDANPEVSQAARLSLEAAFPQSEKRVDVLVLCIKEIFLYLDDNLKLTPENLNDKATPLDELEDMHQRVIASSLLAAATLVDILLGVKFRTNDYSDAEEKNLSKARASAISCAENMFVMHKGFLEFLKSKSPHVRSATYSTLTSYIKHIPQVVNEGNKKLLSSSILGAFQEKDPSCHSSIWELFFVFSRTFPESWSQCNIWKVILNPFWQFLQNGCYGSKRVSYPFLVDFLKLIPSKSVSGEQLIFSFFKNLWAGRDPQYSSLADASAFFNAFKECFIWFIHNTSRYCEADVLDGIQTKFTNDVLLELWHDYLLLVLPKNNGGVSREGFNGSVGGNIPSKTGYSSGLNVSYSMHYMHELGRCIVEIMLNLFLEDYSLLSAFCASLNKVSLKIIEEGPYLQNFHEHAKQIESFFMLLEELVLQKGQTWPIHMLVCPFVEDSFPIIKSMDNPSTVKLLSALVKIFGAVTLFSPRCSDDDKNVEKPKVDYFLQIFYREFVPWCLDGNNHTTDAKLDLLFAMLQEETFSDQWSSIITCATDKVRSNKIDVDATVDLNPFVFLGLLFEKIRCNLSNKCQYYARPEIWQHELLDHSATWAARSSTFGEDKARFLCAVLGGSNQDDQICFLSGQAVAVVYSELLKSFASVLALSRFQWAKHTVSSAQCADSEGWGHLMDLSAELKYNMACSALDVVEGSLFCLKTLDADCPLISSLLAVLFLINWESNMASFTSEGKYLEASQNDIDEPVSAAESNVKNVAVESSCEILNLGAKVQFLLQKLDDTFWSTLGPTILSRMGDILVHAVVFALLNTTELSSETVSTLSCEWLVDLMVIYQNESQLQNLLDRLFSAMEFCAIWAKPEFSDKSKLSAMKLKSAQTFDNEEMHCRFVHFSDKLISYFGFGKIIDGSQETFPSTPLNSAEDHFSSSRSRAWLAIEILCTWKWEGGSALGTFLPSLIEYSEKQTPPRKGKLLNFVIGVLLNGALTQGKHSAWIMSGAWCLSYSQIEKIDGPFLRALLSVLLALNLTDQIWRSVAVAFFKELMNNLFINGAINHPCLGVLPFVMSITIEHFSGQQTNEVLTEGIPENDFASATVLDWLQTANSYLTLMPCASSQEVEDWFQLVLSCYPLKVVGGAGKIKIDTLRNIRPIERAQLLSLFRNFWTTFVASVEGAPSSILISIGAKLMAITVAYCWQELGEDYWNIMFDVVHERIKSSVLIMEEMAETVDGAVLMYKVEKDLKVLMGRLETAVQSFDFLVSSNTESALVVICLVQQIFNFKDLGEDGSSYSKRLGKWVDNMDQMVGSILRLFLTTGATEAIVNSCSRKASSFVASSRADCSQLWELVASVVTKSSVHVRSSGVESMDLWGLSKGAISSLYAILFSSYPSYHLQFAAFSLLASEPISRLSLVTEECLEETAIPNQESDIVQIVSKNESSCLREEVLLFIRKSTVELVTSHEKVNVLLAWALLLSHLQSLSSSSLTREKLIDYIRDSVGSSILDGIFQHIPLNNSATTSKKKDIELAPEARRAALASKEAIISGSLLLCVESLWPIGVEQMASLAGSIYGMVVKLLPSFVRSWFNSIRDRAFSNAVEVFTKTWCSPLLISEELSLVKVAVIADDFFSVSVSKSSAHEIVATYKKEETGMDLLIRLSDSYPLRNIDVECTRSLGINLTKQRKWLLSLTALIRNQNGAIAEAICTWKRNFDKEFEGVEECPICYSIIHASNNSLPKLACKTCKHKFHSACLYKWFSTSHKSTCPLCQSPF